MDIVRASLRLVAFCWLAAPLSAAVQAESTAGFAVVELFTSQGCSSCPPADDNLTRIAQFAEERDLAIYVLSMHVDYWNSLGWDDPFSAKQFTNRQRQYAKLAGSNRFYTPQMIVNGTDGFVGSDSKRAERAISTAVREPAECAIGMKVIGPAGSGNVWQVNYEATGTKPDDILVLCLVADAQATDVERGENAGRSLAHSGVVRAMVRQPLDQSGSGEAELQWPEGQKPASGIRVVAFVQDSRTGKIRGANVGRSADG